MVHCCIEHKKVPNSRPLLTMLSRSASTLSPKATPRHSKNIVSTKQSYEGMWFMDVKICMRTFEIRLFL